MRATLFLGLVACAGCNQILGIGDIALAPTDTAGGGDMGETCYGVAGVSLIQVCPKQLKGSITLGDINTDTEPMCETQGQTNGVDVCAIAAQDITIPNDAKVTGGRPLALVAITTISVNGKLDGSSQIGGQRGAGANYATCAPAAGNNDNTNGGGGGSGGTFGGVGGNGGNSGGGILGGQAMATGTLMGLHGGCPGARGGNAATTDIGGDSGGAIYLLAGTSITLTNSGHVYSGGAGGRGGQSHNGGYGGGSGGLVGVDAPTITLMGMATLDANGGSGGEGGSSQAGTDGSDGKDATTTAMGAKGGSGGTSSGGDGGDGAAGNNIAGMTAQNGNGSGAGGGGGGGSAGIVWVHGALTGGMISPAPQVH